MIMKVIHTIDAVYDENSKVLILGTMPSVKSRAESIYYMHPQNRFWKVLSRVYGEKIGCTKEERKEFILKKGIALFDVLKSCDIENSTDSSIKNVEPNDFSDILKHSQIKTIFTTGKKAYQLYNKYCLDKTKIEAIPLSSTSPANSPKGIEDRLYNEYKKIREITDGL